MTFVKYLNRMSFSLQLMSLLSCYFICYSMPFHRLPMKFSLAICPLRRRIFPAHSSPKKHKHSRNRDYPQTNSNAYPGFSSSAKCWGWGRASGKWSRAAGRQACCSAGGRGGSCRSIIRKPIGPIIEAGLLACAISS
jgi:hypothetical protein